METSTLGNPDLQSDAAPTDMTLEDLAKATDVNELADRQGPHQAENSRQHSQRGTGKRRTTAEQDEGGESQELADEGTGRDPGGSRGIGQKEKSTRWAWNRRGTEECSLYFRSDSGSEGHRVPSPSRRTSTASNGDTGGKGSRTVYLGRAQAFPLRRVESSLAVDARGFGLSGVSADAIGAGLLGLENHTDCSVSFEAVFSEGTISSVPVYGGSCARFASCQVTLFRRSRHCVIFVCWRGHTVNSAVYDDHLDG